MLIMRDEMNWSQKDLDALAERGISADEIERQLRIFRSPPSPIVVIRPCKSGDGIVPMDLIDQERLSGLFNREAGKGRFSRFVPASGAATRMFRDLFDSHAALEEWRLNCDYPSSPFHRQFFSGLTRFAFYPELSAVVRRQGKNPEQLVKERDLEPFIDAMLSSRGLDYGRTPKGLIPFHNDGMSSLTPLEEHLWETCRLLSTCCSESSVHFTVSPDWQKNFADLATNTVRSIEAKTGFRIHVSFSCQDPATDTIATTPDHQPFRTASGELVFRPAGHGALISNLAATGSDLVLIKNIDNVVPGERQDDVNIWWRVVGGLLVELEETIREHWAALTRQAPGAVDSACAFLKDTFGYQPSKACDNPADWALARLNRPIRVCGMVRNTGEPGGGPFWVHTSEGVTRQIVELAQLDQNDPKIRHMVADSTHFNPVFMACGLRNPAGERLDLQTFIDNDAIILTEKSIEGRPIRALERPGLWNGAMAYWNTLFVEVPEEVFQPVKTVNDLLRPGHTTSADL
ncbi:MAG: DUF4301 family protein [Deltaproteobacteria bacterium]|nr:MAG: DUF4301 family protein [Deltaproteobacteria bacterium]